MKINKTMMVRFDNYFTANPTEANTVRIIPQSKWALQLIKDVSGNTMNDSIMARYRDADKLGEKYGLSGHTKTSVRKMETIDFLWLCLNRSNRLSTSTTSRQLEVKMCLKTGAYGSRRLHADISELPDFINKAFPNVSYQIRFYLSIEHLVVRYGIDRTLSSVQLPYIDLLDLLVIGRLNKHR